MKGMRKRKWWFAGLALVQAVSSPAAPQQPDPAVQLGKLRAAFGATRDPAIMHGLYHMTMWSRIYFFPEGRADVRYQLDQFGDPDESFFSKYVKQGRKPKLEWSIKLSRLPAAGKEVGVEVRENSMGTLEAMLMESSLKPAETPSRSVQASLSARKGFAAYRSGTMFERVAFYYLPQSGINPNAGEEPGFTKPKGWPLSKSPYPIPNEEVGALGLGKFLQGATLADVLKEGGYVYATLRSTRSIRAVRSEVDPKLELAVWEKLKDETRGAGPDDWIYFVRSTNYRESVRFMGGEGGQSVIVIGLADWGTKPPYRFLEEAKLSDISVDGASGCSSATYESDLDVRAVAAKADLELKAPVWVKWKHEGIHSGPNDVGYSMPATKHETEIKVDAKEGGGTYIVLTWKTRSVDRLRVWLYGLTQRANT